MPGSPVAAVMASLAAWRAGVESLPEDRIPAPGLLLHESGALGRPDNWMRVRAAMLRALDQWGEAAIAAGWRDVDLLGVHQRLGALRPDACGALVRNWPYRVVALDDRTITLARAATRLVFRGMTNPADSVPLWLFQAEPPADAA